jgi:hypothetical protein
MTPMSDPHDLPSPENAANRPQSQARSVVARNLYGIGVLVVVLSAAALSGCVIPPSLSVDNQDAGANSPPAILSVRSDQTELSEADKAIFQRGSGSMLNVTLLDTDVQDTLFVSVFVNYTVENTTAPRANCSVGFTGAAQRSCTAGLSALCLMADDNNSTLDMTVVVFDREPLASGTPMFQAMPPDGLSASKYFHLDCLPPST